jgi:putative ABC transport system permease protein
MNPKEGKNAAKLFENCLLGASLPEIFLLLTREFTKWVALANLIAWPLAYYFMNKWLEHFAYRSDLDVWLFIISGLTALCLAVLTVSFQSLKAAAADPIESLRYE